MSIASGTSGYWNEELFPKGFILIKPAAAERAISLIINDEFEDAVEFASLLLLLERGIEAEGSSSCPKTRSTIDMMVELAYLDSKNYHSSLAEWRNSLSSLPTDEPERVPHKPTRRTKPSINQRRKP
jgi:hypothetical protein